MIEVLILGVLRLKVMILCMWVYIVFFSRPFTGLGIGRINTQYTHVIP